MPKLNLGLAPKLYSCRLNHTVEAKGKAIIALVKITAGSDRQANWPRAPIDRPTGMVMGMVMGIDRPIARSPGEKTAIHRQHGAGHVVGDRRGQIDGAASDVLRLGPAPQWNARADAFVVGLVAPACGIDRGLHIARRDGVDAHPML